MKRVIIEQDAVLNQYLPQAELKPKTTNLEALCVLGAFLFPYAMLTWAAQVLGKWLNNKPVEPLTSTLQVFALYFGILIFCLLILKIASKFSIYFKRRLWLHRLGISMTPGKHIPWKRLTGWYQEPVAGRPDMARLTLIINKIKPRHWSIILENPAQTEIFQNYLLARAQAGKEIPQQISEILPLPIPQKIRPLGWLLVSAGLSLFILTILPLIFAVILAKRSNIEFNPAMLNTSSGNLEAFILNHFNSSHELCWTVICLGLLCTLLALALAMIGQRLSFYPSQSEEAVNQPT